MAALVVALAGCTTSLQIDNNAPPIRTPPDSETGAGSLDGGGDGGLADLDGALLPLEDAAPDPLADANVDHYVPGCPGLLSCERVVFVTGAPIAVLQLADADTVCTDLAKNPRAHSRIANRLFQAWTSSSAQPVAARFARGTGPYVRPVGVNKVIAANWTDLTDGNVNAIFHDETGKALSAGVKVWTGTTPAGAVTTANCGNWALPGDNATVGVVGGAQGNWSTFTVVPCTAQDAHLYCFEK